MHLKSRYILLLGMVLTAGTAHADAPDPSQVRIQGMNYAGTGCPRGSVAHNISDDAQAFTLLFDSYLVDSTTRDGRPARKSCNINMRLAFPRGWSFTVFSVQVRGYASLDAGVVGGARVGSSVAGSELKEIGRQKLEGPYADDFAIYSDLPLGELAWTPCDNEAVKPFHLKTAIGVRPKRGNFNDNQGEVDDPSLGNNLPAGYVAIDSLDGAIVQDYGIAWKRCPGTEPTPSGPFVATCTIDCRDPAGRVRTYSATEEDSNEARARNKAINRVTNICRASATGRPGGNQCQPNQTQCTVVRR